jgi:hypothetical protein
VIPARLSSSFKMTNCVSVAASETVLNRRPWALPADQNISNWADWIFKVDGERTQFGHVVKGPDPPDTRRNLDILQDKS